MKQSGRKNPCPVCGRTKDADCRWADDVILCHTGTSTRPGDTITINGQKWAFIHHEAGHSGRAAKFKPHQDRSPSQYIRQTPNTPGELLALQTRRYRWSELIELFYVAFHAAWQVKDFYSSTPEELRAAGDLIADAMQKAAALSVDLSMVWRDHPDLKLLHKNRVEEYTRALQFQQRDFEWFMANELQTPCPAAVQSQSEGIE